MFAPNKIPHVESAATPPRLAALPWTVLMVDADDETRARYRQSFALAGCEVVEASDGREALIKALIRPPALVVTEILPFLDAHSTPAKASVKSICPLHHDNTADSTSCVGVSVMRRGVDLRAQSHWRCQ